MHAVLVKYVLPKPVPRTKMLEGFKEAEARFRATLTLIRKYFSYDEVNLTGHSVFSVHPCRPPRILGSDRPPLGCQSRGGCVRPTVSCSSPLHANR